MQILRTHAESHQEENISALVWVTVKIKAAED